jgi:DNA invertase Pin-like site-specific DNA recombinase
MQFGYARVSTDSQDHALQLDALHNAGCERVFVETASGSRADRPELAHALETARSGDTLVVWRLDRVARSLRHLIEISDDLQGRGVALRSLTESLDTSTPSGRFLFSVLGALGQIEVEILREHPRRPACRRSPRPSRRSSSRARQHQGPGRDDADRGRRPHGRGSRPPGRLRTLHLI